MSTLREQEIIEILERFGVELRRIESRRIVVSSERAIDGNTLARLRHALRRPVIVELKAAAEQTEERQRRKSSSFRRLTNATRRRTKNAVRRASGVFATPGEELDVRLIEEAVERSEVPAEGQLNRLVQIAVRAGASDLHLEPLRDHLRVRIRVDGLCRELERLPTALAPSIGAQVKAAAELRIAEQRLPQDGRVGFIVDGRSVDTRVSLYPSSFGEAFVLRFLNVGPMAEAWREQGTRGLALPPDCLRELSGGLQVGDGLVLMTGATGSGKTTTLYAALADLAYDDVKVVTVEDPVEQILPGITQIGVRADVGFGFGKILRHVLRHDPDVILIGEIRDEETARIAMRSSLTGHKVLSTLHTRDAPGAVARLRGLNIERELIAASVTHVYAQRLLRVLCASCALERPAGPGALAYLAQVGLTIPAGASLRGPKQGGCEECRRSGIARRLPILETMRLGEQVKAVIGRSHSPRELREAATREGYISLPRRAGGLALQGVISLAEWLRVCPPLGDGEEG